MQQLSLPQNSHNKILYFTHLFEDSVLSCQPRTEWGGAIKSKNVDLILHHQKCIITLALKIAKAQQYPLFANPFSVDF